MSSGRKKRLVTFKGLLGVEYDSQYETCFEDLKDVIKEFCAKYKGFREKILNLHKDGYEYVLLKKEDEFVVMPIICGGAGVWGIIGGGLLAIGAIFTAGALAAALLSTTILGMSAGTLGMLGAAFMMLGTLAKPAAKVAGAESDSNANKTSNNMGIEQGSPAGTPIQIGYGMILVAGSPISSSLHTVRGNVDVANYLSEEGR